MVTTRIQVKPHLKEYISGKYNQFSDEKVIFPDNLDIYHLIFNLTEKRPSNVFFDSGNLEIALPERLCSKQPKTYNYLGIRSQKMIERKIEQMFWADFRDYVEYEHHKNGIRYVDLVYEFMRKYDIHSISEDALIKNYYRWRKKVRNSEKRTYNSRKFR
ncbi:hypothetical protein FACS1894145_7410 [Bacteroidia bacterium]|nr:hypothetical protein FACS1894145_7410 [Bacteroidia bacterium]